MYYYLVKETCIATADNPTYADCILTYYYGKGQQLVGKKGRGNVKPYWNDTKIWKQDIVEYGYKRECDAKRNFNFKENERSKFWAYCIEIIKVKI